MARPRAENICSGTELELEPKPYIEIGRIRNTVGITFILGWFLGMGCQSCSICFNGFSLVIFWVRDFLDPYILENVMRLKVFFFLQNFMRFLSRLHCAKCRGQNWCRFGRYLDGNRGRGEVIEKADWDGRSSALKPSDSSLAWQTKKLDEKSEN